MCRSARGEWPCVWVCVRAVATGEGEGVRGVMLQSFLAVAGEDGVDTFTPGRQGRR